MVKKRHRQLEWYNRFNRWSRRKPLFGISFVAFLLCCSYIQLVNEYSDTSSCYLSTSSVVKHHVFWDNPDILPYIRDYLLLPPSQEPYHLVNDISGAAYSQRFLEDELWPAMFGNKKAGIFVEAGAADGETGSNTLYLERHQGWNGLLVEPNLDFHEDLLGKHRKAWISLTCLSLHEYAHTDVIEQIELQGQLSRIGGKLPDTLHVCPYPSMENLRNWIGIYSTDSKIMKLAGCRKPNRTYNNITCMPLASLLLALGIRSVDYLSLDVEGVEFKVLQTFPFHEIDVKILQVEVTKLKNDKSKLLTLMNEKGYERLLNVTIMEGDQPYHIDVNKIINQDYIFVKKGLTLPIT